MKKFLVLLLCAMMMFAFVACEPDTPEPGTEAVENAAWYMFVDDAEGVEEEGYWEKTTKPDVYSQDAYEIDVKITKGKTVDFYVDGVKIGTKKIDIDYFDGGNKISAVFICNRVMGAVKGEVNSNATLGESYTTTWTTPTLNGEAIEGWVSAFDSGFDYENKNGKIVLATKPDSYKTGTSRYQGMQANITHDIPETGTEINTTLTIDKADLAKAGFAPSIWVRVGDDNQFGWVILQLGVGDAETVIR